LKLVKKNIMKKVNWLEIGVFYFVAVIVSAPFRLGLIQIEKVLPLPYGLNSLYTILRGIGPLVGFVVVFYFFKSSTKRQLSFWGKKRLGSILAAIIIPIGLSVVGIQNNSGFNPHYYGILYGFTLIFYSLGEEYGWRGYLQEALAPLKTFQKILLIAILWYVWHLNFLIAGISIKTHIIHFISLILGSWGLLRITEITKSILFACAVHLSFNLLSDLQGSLNDRLIIIFISIGVWILLLILMYKKRTFDAAEEK